MAFFGLAFTACGGDDEPSGKTEQFLSAAPNTDTAVRVDASGDDLVGGFKDETTGESTGIVSAETTEDGKVVLGIIPGTKLDRPTVTMPGVKKKNINALLTILFFDCTLNGNTYVLPNNLGSLTVIKEGKIWKFILKIYEYTFTFTLTPSEKLPASDRTTSLARDWKVKESQVQTKVGGVTVARNFNGCNLKEIEAWIIKQGVHIADKDKLPAGSNIVCLGFTASKTYYIKYENKNIDAADWWWANEKNGELKYTWRGDDMGNAYEDGICTAKFYDGDCQLTIEATIHGADGNTYPSKVVATLVDK